MTSFDERRDYTSGILSEETVDADPFEQFRSWFAVAQESDAIDEASAMTVATASSDGVPSARIALLRNVDTGFVFYTNYDSHKGSDLEANPVAALVFYWGPLERQIRINGTVTRVSSQESDEYFAGRPYRSRLGALASPQSSVIPDASVLADRLAELEQTYPKGSAVPRPAHWGGYRVTPSIIEFWQGRRSRLHDRIRYRATADEWVIERLAP